MATTYPSTIQTFTNPSGTSTLDNPDHATQHANENDTIVAIQNTLGTTAGTALFTAFSASDKPAKKNNETFGTPTITGGTINNAALTTPKITTSINDTNGNPIIVPTATASAVNGVGITNGATGTGPTIQPAGASSDANADLILQGKGTGKVKEVARYGVITTDTDGATVTFDMSASNIHTVTLGGNRTLAVSNVSVGQCFILRLVQDATGSRTVTWFTTIKWAGGSAPTLTTTASKADTFGFICTSSGNYDGYIVGQNL